MNVTNKPSSGAPLSNDALEAHWMPFSSNREFKASPRMVKKSEGMYLWNQNGDKLIDGSSGLFNVAAGHGRKEIAEAIKHSADTLDYAPPFQIGRAHV